jgi:hypothetical protein
MGYFYRLESMDGEGRGAYIVFTFGQKYKWPDPHVDKVATSDWEVGQEHDKVPVIEVAYAVVDPRAMLLEARVSAPLCWPHVEM